MDKEHIVHIYSGILVMEKNEIILFATTWMDLETIMLSEDRERQILYITCMWDLKKWYK